MQVGWYTVLSVIGITNQSLFGLNNRLPRADVFTNSVFDSTIHTVLLHSATWELADPVIELGSDQQLELRFDDISNNSRVLAYTLVHCDQNWQRSTINQQEYLSGFGQGTISEHTVSINTTYDYVNYRLLFPVDECKPLISGNYVIEVFDENDPGKILLTHRFYVIEKTMQVEASLKQPSYGEEKETGQQLVFTVTFNTGDVRDPVREITPVAIQNNRDDRILIFNKPFSVTPGRLEYTDNETGIFQGGNEFRSFDIRNMKYQSEHIASIEFPNPYYHVFLKTDQDRGAERYFSNTDLNGGYYIAVGKSDEKHTEADYVYVHFKLSLPPVYTGDEIYVSGEFVDWQHTALNRMKFNEENQSFETVLLLKQGLYNYCYEKKNEDGSINEYGLEGSHYETGNDYALFIYYHDFHEGYDRLTGYLQIK
jgi:hypothetical protein